jgi:hypothetical protein
MYKLVGRQDKHIFWTTKKHITQSTFKLYITDF